MTIATAKRSIKRTRSLCATCLRQLDAEVIEVEGAVRMRKRCPEHGEQDVLLASDARLYWASATATQAPGCCSLGYSCTMMFEITDRCNLACPTCFAGSSPQRAGEMSLAMLEARLDGLDAAGRKPEIVQLSGGEPTIHPEFEAMVETCLSRGVRKLYVNTNGLRLAQQPDLAHRLAELGGARERLQFYLQFDGFEEPTYVQIRGARRLFPAKQAAIANLEAAGLFAMPVMTVTRGVNLHEIGAVIRLVLEHHPRMNTVMLQPAFHAGRYTTRRAGERMSAAEVAHEVVRQTDGMFALEDFGPIPCSHPNCFTLAVGLVHDGRVVPISRYFPGHASWSQPDVAPMVAALSNTMPQHMLDAIAEHDLLDSLLDLLAGAGEDADFSAYQSFVVIGIKPFMDAATYDQDRVDRCCSHVMTPAGQPMSLCEYNVLHRAEASA